MTLRFVLPTVVCIFGASCASTGTDATPAANSSSASIRAAEEVGAAHSPDAALYLQLAKEQFEHARQLTDAKDKDRADRLLLRAQADAELALALARSDSEKTEAQGAINKVKSLKETTVQ
jgi:hypothetical protein